MANTPVYYDGTNFRNGSGGGAVIIIDSALSGAPAATVRILVGDSPYDALAADQVIFCQTDGGAITVNLPAGIEGTNYKIINCGSSGNDVTIDGDAAETVIGDLTQTLADGEVLELHYNAIEGWW